MKAIILLDDEITVTITTTETGYDMEAIGPRGQRLVDEANWGTTPLMDRLHVCLVQLHGGIAPQLQASSTATNP